MDRGPFPAGTTLEHTLDLDAGAAARLLEVITRADAEVTRLPHVVVRRGRSPGALRCSGPYPTALDALLAAADHATESGEDIGRYTIAPLLAAPTG
jgi:hypothetical protein